MTNEEKLHLRISMEDQMLIELWAKLSGKGMADSLVDLVKEKMFDELQKNKKDFLDQIKNHAEKMNSLKCMLSDKDAIEVLEKRIEFVNGLYDMLVEYVENEEKKDQKRLN